MMMTMSSSTRVKPVRFFINFFMSFSSCEIFNK
jgi:hypothetical protein